VTSPPDTPDPRALPTFTVALHGAKGAGRSSLRRALLDLPYATDADLAHLEVLLAEEAPPANMGGTPIPPEAVDDGAPPREPPGAAVLVVRGAPDDDGRARLAAICAPQKLVAVHARDLADPAGDDAVREAWATLAGEGQVHLTATPEGGATRGVDGLRAALFALAVSGIDASVAEARRAKRPYAAAIVTGAVLATAAEALLPGAAVLVVTSQVGAIGSLSYLYTGRLIGRGQALALLPVFATEAAGGSLFLFAKSFLPPTGIADAAAAVVAATLTLSMLGAVAWTLEQGYSLDQKDKLREAFRRLRARSVAERAEIFRNRSRWRDRSFWADLTQRFLFEG
jgi:hypothetical protein